MHHFLSVYNFLEEKFYREDCFSRKNLVMKNVADSLVDLSNKQISCLNDNVFNGLTKLQTLYLHQNQISSINEKTFNGLTNLKELWLGDNQIKDKEQIKKARVV